MLSNSECCFCHEDEMAGLVYDQDRDVWAHLSCINNGLLDPSNKEAVRLSYLLEPVDEEDFDA